MVTWPSQEVEMKVRHIKPKGFKAQVATRLKGQPVHRSNPTLDSVNGMDSFARKLNKRRPVDDYGIDWEQVVEDLSGIVIDTYRTGKPAVKLHDVDLSDNMTWRIDNIVLEKDISLIWADGGTGKSLFAVFLSVLAQQGYMSSEHGLVVEPSNVLYLDYETKEKELGKRTRMIHAGLGLEAFDVAHTNSSITYNKCEFPLVDEEDYIKDIMWENDINLVVIDSMGRAVGGELESPDSVLAFFQAVERLDTTVLLISHANKQGFLFGSAYTSNSARLVWEAKLSGRSERSMDFSLFCRKANNVPIQEAQSWGVEFIDGAAVYTRKDVMDTDDAGELSYAELVYSIIKEAGNGKTREYIKEVIRDKKKKDTKGYEITSERSDRNTDSAVSKQKAAGKITEDTDGLLSLAIIKQALEEGSQEEAQWLKI